MEKGQFLNLADATFIEDFNKMDDEDYGKLQKCNTWLRSYGIIDGTYEPEYKMYCYVLANKDLIGSIYHAMAFKLCIDTESKQVWLDELPEDEGGMYSPFRTSKMNGNQVILLSILQKHLSTNTSSKNIGLEFPEGVYLTEYDIIQEMKGYMEKRLDDKRKVTDAKAAINTFTKETGILRVVMYNIHLEDGSQCPLYKISPFIEHHFDVEKINNILNQVITLNEKKEENKENEDD